LRPRHPHSHFQCRQLPIVKPVPPPLLLPSTSLRNRSHPPPLLNNLNKIPRLLPPILRLVPCPPPLLCLSNRLNHTMRFHCLIATIYKISMRTAERTHHAATSVQVEERVHKRPTGYGHRGPAVNGSRPASYVGHVVGNGANFNLPVGAVVVNAGMNLANMNLRLAPSQPVPWVAAQRSPQAVAIAQYFSPHIHSGSL
jgi:hypothetical protein